MMTMYTVRVRGDRKSLGGEDVLPHPLPVGIQVLLLQRWRQVHAAQSFRQVLVVQPFDPLEVLLQRGDDAVRQHCHSILGSFAITHDDLAVREVQVADSQPPPFFIPHFYCILKALMNLGPGIRCPKPRRLQSKLLW